MTSVSATGSAAHSARLAPVYVWQAPVRVTHWLIFLSMIFLAVTGIYIGNPFIVVPGRAGASFVMGWMKAIHYYAAIVFTLSVLARIWWMLAGNRYSKWTQFVPVERRRRGGLVGTLLFYLMVRRRPPFFVGHNPLAGAAYTLVFLLYLVIIATGLGLYGQSAHLDSPLRHFAFLAAWFGGAQSARFIHHVVMWLLIGFVAHHVWSSFLVSTIERNGTLDSIFSGYKYLDPEEVAEAHGEGRREKR
jgi:Ni/Fe-hydrogenase 1 B-type cytochrome subunit